jgi:hypothetical protein
MKVNNHFKILAILLTFVFLSILPIKVLAATGYGESTYGSGDYNIGITTVQNDPNSSSSNNAASASVCHDSPPVLIPDLFQINTTSQTAKLFFTPIEFNQYYISFSVNPNAEENGELVTLTREGVQSHTVYYLKPNTTYYFKIRSQNGCMPGNWSNIMIITTSSSTKQKIFYRYSKTITVTNSIKSFISKVIPSKNTKEETVSSSPTAAPTVTTKSETPSAPISTNEPVTKKKFCILWWCF